MKPILNSRFLARAAIAALVLQVCAGCAMTEKRPPPSVSIHLQSTPALPAHLVRPVMLEKPPMMLYVKNTSELTERDLDRAELDQTAGGPYVRLVFDGHGALILRTLTTQYRNRYLVVFLDGRPVMAYYITRTINDGRLTLIADIPEAEAMRIVEQLQPAKLERRRAP